MLVRPRADPSRGRAHGLGAAEPVQDGARGSSFRSMASAGRRAAAAGVRCRPGGRVGRPASRRGATSGAGAAGGVDAARSRDGADSAATARRRAAARRRGRRASRGRPRRRPSGQRGRDRRSWCRARAAGRGRRRLGDDPLGQVAASGESASRRARTAATRSAYAVASVGPADPALGGLGDGAVQVAPDGVVARRNFSHETHGAGGHDAAVTGIGRAVPRLRARSCRSDVTQRSPRSPVSDRPAQALRR